MVCLDGVCDTTNLLDTCQRCHMENPFLDDHVGAEDEDESDTPHHFLFHAIGYGGAAGWNFMVLPKYLFSTNIKISSHVGGSRYAGSSLPAGT